MPWHDNIFCFYGLLQFVCYAVSDSGSASLSCIYVPCSQPRPTQFPPCFGLIHNTGEQNSPVSFKWRAEKGNLTLYRQFVIHLYPSNSAVIKCTWNCAMIVRMCYNMLHRHFVTCFITVYPDSVVCSVINYFLIIFSKYKPTGYMRKAKITTNISRKPSTYLSLKHWWLPSCWPHLRCSFYQHSQVFWCLHFSCVSISSCH